MGASEWWRHPVAFVFLWYISFMLIPLSAGLIAILVLPISPEQFLFYWLPVDYQTLPVFTAVVLVELLVLTRNFVFVLMITSLCLAYLCSVSIWLKRLE